MTCSINITDDFIEQFTDTLAEKIAEKMKCKCNPISGKAQEILDTEMAVNPNPTLAEMDAFVEQAIARTGNKSAVVAEIGRFSVPRKGTTAQVSPAAYTQLMAKIDEMPDAPKKGKATEKKSEPKKSEPKKSEPKKSEPKKSAPADKKEPVVEGITLDQMKKVALSVAKKTGDTDAVKAVIGKFSNPPGGLLKDVLPMDFMDLLEALDILAEGE